MAEDPTASSLVLFPAIAVLIGIIPKQICDDAAVWYVARLGECLNLIHGINVLRNTTVHAHDFFVYDSDQGHVVEAVEERLPEWKFISSLNLVEETINSCNSLRLVISSENDHLFWVSDFQREEQTNDLTALLTPINVISHEQISGILADDLIILLSFVFVAHFFQHVQKIVILTVDVAEYLHWRLELNKRFFFLENFLNFLNQEFHYLVWQVDEGDIFWIFCLVENDVVIKIKDDHIHYK